MYLVALAENDGKKNSKGDGNLKALMKGGKRTSEVSKLGISYWFNTAIQVNVVVDLSHLIVHFFPVLLFLISLLSWGIAVGIRGVVTALADE